MNMEYFAEFHIANHNINIFPWIACVYFGEVT